jgi:catalase-peroxidase
MNDEPKCPFPHEQIKAAAAVATGQSKQSWWPNKVSLDALTHKNPKSNPLGEDFNYAEEFGKLYLPDVKDFIRAIMTDSGPRLEESAEASGLGTMPYGQKYWWPADWGHYGPLFIRLAWHSAGTYRVSDGRGGAGNGLIRFAPLNSWPDNANLDKARRILFPVKERYGNSLSWADLMILAGNVALEEMGLKTFGFAGGREDAWEADNTYWGSETAWLANERHREQTILDNPLAATHMGLIYVNPEGPNGNAEDFVGSARDIRTTFARMAMNDEETVALIAGGHAFGKSHGNGDPSKLGPEPEGAPLENVGFGWLNPEGKGHSEDTITSGIEGAWTPTPLRWDNKYLEILYKYEWEKVISPAGAQQWSPINCEPEDMVPDAHIAGKMNKPMMLTTDLALRFGDPEYDKICRVFLKDLDYFADKFARAWFKLTHRDMGPTDRYLGEEVPAEVLLWQDPVNKNTYSALTDRDINNLKGNINLALEKTDIEEIDYDRNGNPESRKLDLRDLIYTAWVSASTYRDTDKRGGANGARLMLEPMKSWSFTDYERVEKTIRFLSEIKNSLGIKMSLADLIVFGGNVGVERAAKNAGYSVNIPFVGGRGDATQDQVDQESFGHLEPVHDGFLNWTKQPVDADILNEDRKSVV